MWPSLSCSSMNLSFVEWACMYKLFLRFTNQYKQSNEFSKHLTLISKTYNFCSIRLQKVIEKFCSKIVKWNLYRTLWNQINYRIYESHYISSVNRNARPIHHIVKALKESLFSSSRMFCYLKRRKSFTGYICNVLVKNLTFIHFLDPERKTTIKPEWKKDFNGVVCFFNLIRFHY